MIFLCISLVAALFGNVLGDVNIDWPNTAYVAQSRGKPAGDTAAARQSIVKQAGSTAQKGPWSVVDKGGVLPPSKDAHDYLSWAPYWWPDCCWCNQPNTCVQQTKGKRHGHGHHSARELPAARDLHAEGVSDHFPTSRLRMIRAMLDSERPAPTGSGFANASFIGPSLHSRATKTKPCKPSPTPSLAPTATYTICPYARKDGQRVPDVDMPKNANSIQRMAESTLFNAYARVLSNSASYQASAIKVIRAWFLDAPTAMKPNMNFAQMIRGPPGSGDDNYWAGVLDARGLVKVVNAIWVLAADGTGAQPKRDSAGGDLRPWMVEYQKWLQTSTSGTTAAKKPNNHGTFYAVQLAAVQLMSGDRAGAISTLEGYFAGLYKEQIARSGAQPYEASRTQPFHYATFNLEAMITAAKMGEELGLDFWDRRTTYGATIQTAIDYLMQQSASAKDTATLLPHVAAARIAYGDPGQRYQQYLQAHAGAYQSQPYWFYNQPDAFPIRAQQSHQVGTTAMGAPDAPADKNDGCPPIFDLTPEVELDYGVFVSCADVKPFYLLPALAKESVPSRPRPGN